MTLAGRCGLVVGVSSERSLGFACVEQLRKQAAEVIATVRPGPSRDAVAAKLSAAGCVQTAHLDVNQPEEVARLMELVARTWGRLDFLVHTIVRVPADALAAPLLEVSRQTFAQVMSDAVHSLITLCAGARTLLAASGQSAIVTLTSESSRLATPNYHVAGISKAALEAAVRYLAFELGPLGATCNAVSAPAISTDGADATVGAAVMARTAQFLGKHNMTGRPVGASDVGDAVAFLVGGGARSITGQVLTADGGYSKLYF